MKTRLGTITAKVVSACFLALTNSVQAQTASITPAGALNVLTVQPRSGGADYTAVINKQIAAGKTLYLPNTGKPYIITDSLTFSAPEAGLTGEKGTTIVINTNKTIFRVLAPDITLHNILFDGQPMGKAGKGEAYCIRPGFKWDGGGMHYGGPTFLQKGCDNAAMSDLTYDFNESTAFTVGARNVSITKSHFANNVGFGIAAVAGAENFRFDGNSTRANGIEFAGIMHGAKTGEIADNTVDGTGDNCISVSGDNVKVTGNTLKNCLGHGVGVYGSNNTVTGNRVSDAGQVYNALAKPVMFWNGTSRAIYHSPGYFLGHHAGVKIVNGFGGLGQHNVVVHNDITGDQANPTSDGIGLADQASGNTVGPNTIGRYRSHAFKDETAAHANKIIGR